MILEHVAFDLCDEVCLLENSVSRRLVVSGQITQGHQSLKVFQAVAFMVQQVADGTDNINGLEE